MEELEKSCNGRAAVALGKYPAGTARVSACATDIEASEVAGAVLVTDKKG